MVCQIYIYDDYKATKQSLKDNIRLSKQHMEIILNVLNDINPYAKKYKYLHQLTKNEKLSEYCLYFTRNINLNKNRYSAPSTAECAALIVSKDGSPKMQDREKSQSYLSKLLFHVDPMTFPIMFPSEDLGWSPLFKQDTNTDQNLSPLKVYSSCLIYRPNNKFDPIFFCGRLTQQYVIQAYIIIESNRLNFYRYNQKKLRIEGNQGIVIDHVARSAFNNSNNFNELERLGNVFVLPSIYLGSYRHMHQNYQDAMAIVRAIGRPDFN